METKSLLPGKATKKRNKCSVLVAGARVDGVLWVNYTILDISDATEEESTLKSALTCRVKERIG
jgi:hypothetical protein